MAKQKVKVSLQILENTYQLSCDAHERNLLIEAADVLNSQLHEMRRDNPRVPLERLAIMTAIQIAFDLQQERETLSKEIKMVNEISERLNSAVDIALSDNEIAMNLES